MRRLWISGVYFVAVFVVGMVSGSATSMLVYRSLSLFDYMVKPLFSLSWFGAIPAFLLGLVFAFLLRRFAGKQGAVN